MPSFHYEAERWGIQFVVDSKSFAERHSPLFRGSPVKTKPSQARGLQDTQGSLLAKFDEGGGGEKEKSGVNHLFQKIRRHQIFTKRHKETLPSLKAQQGKAGF